MVVRTLPSISFLEWDVAAQMAPRHRFSTIHERQREDFAAGQEEVTKGAFED